MLDHRHQVQAHNSSITIIKQRSNEMKFSTKLTLLSVAIFSLSVSATTLPVLVSSSDAVVVGTEFNPAQVGKAFTFYITVDRVLSGNVQNGTTLNVVWNSRKGAQLPANAVSSYRGIWFLRKAENGNWECISAGSTGNAEFFPELSLPVSDGPLPAELTYDPALTPLEDQILLEMVADPSARPNYAVAINVAAGMRSPGALRAFRYLAKSQIQRHAIVGITLLLLANDSSALAAMEPMVDQLKQDVSRPDGSDGMVNTIKFFFQTTDPAAIASLGRMATSDKTAAGLRDASASALARIYSAEAVPWLGMLLDSDSEQMQIYGAQV